MPTARPARSTDLSSSQARRIALAAQGFDTLRSSGRVDRRHVRRLLDRIGLIQVDSVNVLVRTQEMPLFSRLGSHPRDLLPRMTADAELFEYWCHEASLLPIDLFPLIRWRMARSIEDMWRSMSTLGRDEPAYIESVYEEVRDRGPLAHGELTDPGTKTAGMWGRSKGKKALEYLFWAGRLSARRRVSDFARVYDLTERMIPAEVLARPAPAEDAAKRELLALAARHLGVATARDLADYHRLNLPKARPLIADLVEDGLLEPVTVQGWKDQAYLHPVARLPRWVRARSLLSPFDSLVWERSRTERVFGFRYRIEIYVPPPKRVHGYYVLPFLLGDQLVARVDLKADRAASALLVQSAHVEPAADAGPVAIELAAELVSMAAWLGLERVVVVGRGDLAPALGAAI
ncbi:MAG: crosslink repair DNA glycosylase YcaQ family protein [Acidimicrobiales bacterium]